MNKMEKFKAGDKFILRKPIENNTGLRWFDGMDRFSEKTLTIEKIYSNVGIQPKETIYCFHPDWCEKVEIGVDVASGKDYSVMSEVRVSSSEIPNNHDITK